MMVVDIEMGEKKLVVENNKIRVIVDIDDAFRVRGARKIKKYCTVK
jgi:hypothetical protein